MTIKSQVNQTESEIRSIGKNSIIYSVGNVAVKIISFILIPLYTHYLSLQEVGIVILLELIELLYGYIAPLGITSAIWRFYYQSQESGNDKRYLFSNYLFMIFINLFLLIILIFTSKYSARYILSDVKLSNLVCVFYIALFFSLNRLFIFVVLRIKEQSVQFIMFILAYFILLLSLTIILIVVFGLGLWGVVLAKLITSFLIFIFGTIYLIRNFGYHYYQPDVNRSLQYGFPLIFHGISLLILSMSDRYFIKEIISVEAVAIYGIAYKFGMIINMILVTPFIQAWQPILFRLENNQIKKITYQRIALHFVQIAILIWLIVSIGSEYLIKLTTTKEYYTGIIIVPFIAFSYMLYGLQDIFKAGAILNNETKKITYFGVVTAILNIILNIIFIPILGIIGAAIATTVSYAILMFLILFLSQKFLYIAWRWAKMGYSILLGIIIYSINYSIHFNNIYVQIVNDLLTIIIFIVLMIVFKLASFSEIKRLSINLFRKDKIT